MNNVIKKLAEAKDYLKGTEMKKSGHNKFSNYFYFTPEDVDRMANDACSKFGLLTVYSLQRDNFGKPVGTLTVYEIKSGEAMQFTQITETPEIKATNIAQQMGGMVTYNERYLTMSAFGIKDNSLDFDAHDNTKTATKRIATPKVNDKMELPLSGDKFDAAVTYLKSGKTIEDIETKYKLSKEVREKLLKNV